MNNKTITQSSQSDKRIDYACQNFKKINKSDNEKFKNLDIWLKKESNIFKREITYIPTKFMKYKKGTIVKVDFGLNIGAELSNIHFAITMDNDDNIYKETISVIPLTSKQGKSRLDLGSLIFDEFINKMNKEIKNINNEDDLKEIKDLILEYNKYKKSTFANISQFRCISKNRIIYPLNKHDIIGKSKVSKTVLNKITQELVRLYINLKKFEKKCTEKKSKLI